MRLADTAKKTRIWGIPTKILSAEQVKASKEFLKKEWDTFCLTKYTNCKKLSKMEIVGSRKKGTNHPLSDLDVKITMYPLKTKKYGFVEDASLATIDFSKHVYEKQKHPTKLMPIAIDPFIVYKSRDGG